ncbi:hypothetical protein WN51_13153 [Melipona quadrifasciata]|uniref:Uncharacterized protein n=1 Tax=Melipona quadrifasciata TaxID=166423 RepID=A0A0N0BGF3_9HYME|nr:hypothetical protein WN51_13153 [Melipona quadrifasciata]
MYKRHTHDKIDLADECTSPALLCSAHCFYWYIDEEGIILQDMEQIDSRYIAAATNYHCHLFGH